MVDYNKTRKLLKDKSAGKRKFDRSTFMKKYRKEGIPEGRDTGPVEAAARGAVHGATMHTYPYIAGAVEATYESAKNLINNEDVTFGEDFQKSVKDTKEEYDLAEDKHPIITNVAEIGSSFINPIPGSSTAAIGQAAAKQGVKYAGKQLAKRAAKNITARSAAEQVFRGDSLIEGDVEGVGQDAVLGAAGAQLLPVGKKLYPYAKDAYDATAGKVINGVGQRMAEVTNVKTDTIRDAFKLGYDKGINIMDNDTVRGIRNQIVEMPKRVKEGIETVDTQLSISKSKMLLEMDGWFRKNQPEGIDARHITGIQKDYIQALRNDRSGAKEFYSQFDHNGTLQGFKKELKNVGSFVTAKEDERNKLMREVMKLEDNVLFKSTSDMTKYNDKVADKTQEYIMAMDNFFVMKSNNEITEHQYGQLMEELDFNYQVGLEEYVKKHMRTIYPSELDKFKRDLYERLDYGTQKIKVGNISAVLKTGRNNIQSEELERIYKKFAANQKDFLNSIADGMGHDLRSLNKKLSNIKDAKELLPDATQFAAEVEPKNISSGVDRVQRFMELIKDDNPELLRSIKNETDDLFGKFNVIKAADTSYGGVSPSTLTSFGSRIANRTGLDSKAIGSTSLGQGMGSNRFASEAMQSTMQDDGLIGRDVRSIINNAPKIHAYLKTVDPNMADMFIRKVHAGDELELAKIAAQVMPMVQEQFSPSPISGPTGRLNSFFNGKIHDPAEKRVWSEMIREKMQRGELSAEEAGQQLNELFSTGNVSQ